MISAHLEKLIWEGEAEYLVCPIGSPSQQIEVGENQAVIITDIDYFPFIDSGVATLGATENWKRALKQITVASKSKRYTYAVRNYFTPASGMQSDRVHFDTYCTFNDTINIGISDIPAPRTWTMVNGLNPVGTKAPRSPLGYGQTDDGGITTMVSARILAIGEVRSSNQTRSFGTIQFSLAKFEWPIIAATALINPSQDATNIGAYQFPLLNIGYVKINKNLRDKFI